MQDSDYTNKYIKGTTDGYKAAAGAVGIDGKKLAADTTFGLADVIGSDNWRVSTDWDIGGAMTEIRFAVPEDLQDILDIYAPYVTGSTITFEYQLPTRQDFALRMAQVQAVYPWLVFVRDGTVEGYAYASAFNPRAAYDWSADLSVYMKANWTLVTRPITVLPKRYSSDMAYSEN